MDNSSATVFDGTVWKSSLDDREYRVIHLENGLRAILVSDVKNLVDLDLQPKNNTITDNHAMSEDDDESDDSDEEDDDNTPKGEKMAACALSVQVGSFNDPPHIPGLAHFLEHMVFMGSAKYPKENAIDDFLKNRGGSNNAFTDVEHTTFHIECREVNLEEGMDVFSQFFIAPLMMKEAMTREREAIDSEFSLALPSDGSAAEQLLGTLAPPGHPAGFFPWGNLITLRDRITDDKLHKAVHDFWLNHYSANRMTVAVVARLPLDTLEKFVRQSFSAVPNNGLVAPDFSRFRGQFGTGDFHSLMWVKPVHDLCEVMLTWVLPPLLDEFEARPLSYLSRIMGHEGEGSLLSYLRKKVWCLQSTAGNDGSGLEFNSIYSTFSITLELTQDGLQNLDQVLNTVFIYLATLKASLPDQRCFDEAHDITSALFKYKNYEDAAKYAEKLCENLFRFPPDCYLTGDFLYLKYKPSLIKDLINEFRADNVNVMIHCREKPDDFYDLEETWFGTKYKKLGIPQEWEKSWIEAQPSSEFFLPPPNPYITKRFTLQESNEVVHPDYPEKVLSTDIVELWYRQDLKFKRPFATYKLYLQSTKAKESCQYAVNTDVMSSFLRQKLEGEFYSAYEAGCEWDCSVGDFGLIINFIGHDEKLPLLFERLLRRIREVTVVTEADRNVFEAIRTDLTRDYNNKFLESDDLNRIMRLNLLLQSYFTPMEKLSALKLTSLEGLREFCSSYFSSISVQMLIQGNVSKETAVGLAKKLPTLLNISSTSERPKVIVWNMQEGNETICRIPSFNPSDTNASITNYYQYGPSLGSLRVQCLIDLLMMVLNEPLFDTLRTQQQLGYDVSAEARDTFGIMGFSVTVHYQSAKFTADQVNERMDAFLKLFSQKLKDMAAEEVQEAKDTLCALKRVEDLSIAEEATRNFAEITSGEYKFNRLPQEIEIIPTITQEELCQWFDKYSDIQQGAKKLSVQVVRAEAHNNVIHNRTYTVQPISPDPAKFISDVSVFQKTRKFYPPQPASAS